MPEGTPTVRRRRLGAELRRLREVAGLTLEEAGRGLERTAGTISRIENGRNAIRAIDVRLLLDLYRVADDEIRERLATLARNSNKRGWWQTYSDLLSPAYSDFISLEADAVRVRTFETMLVPGLLQTAEYARALFAAVDLELQGPQIETLVQVRMEREAVLTRQQEPLRFAAVLSEAALLLHVGDSEVMRAQLGWLLEMADLPNVTLQVLPLAAGPHPTITRPFIHLDFPEAEAIQAVVLDNMTSILYLEDSAEVVLYVRAFERLQSAAMGPDESRSMISRMSDAL